MLTDPVAVFAAYAGGSAALSLAMARISPAINRKIRSVFAGMAPLSVIYGGLLMREDSVTLHGGDLLTVGGLVAVGTGMAWLAGKRKAAGDDASTIRRLNA